MTSAAVSRDGGKLGPAVQLRLEAVSREAAGGGEEAELVLTALPGFDAPGARVEFLLPLGWAATAGDADRREDLVSGIEAAFRLAVRVPAGAPRGAAARLTAGGMSREVYATLGGGAGPPALGGRLDTDAEGRPVRVFPSGEKERR
jgi:hypothetical protein